MKDLKKFYPLLNSDYRNNNEGSQIRPLKKKSKTFDLCRGLAVIFMIFVHVLGLYAHPKVYASSFGYLIDFLGSPPAAPVFMVIMGILFMYSSRNKSLESAIKRGLILFTLGIVLSFLRSDLLLFYWANPVDYSAFWEVDILQFAGLAYICMALIRHYFPKPLHWLYMAISIMMISPYLWGIEARHLTLDWLLHYLWGSDELVYFPLFHWLYYPLMGMVIGHLIKSIGEEEVLKVLSRLGLGLLILGSLISLTNLDFHVGDYFRGGQGSVIWISGFVLVWMRLARGVTSKFNDSITVNTICYWGRHTPKIYIFHWLLISWGTLFIKESSQGYLMTINLMVIALFLSHLFIKHSPKKA
jgi:uncharacterized membrane protein